MESIQQQISTLTRKVDRVHQILVRVGASLPPDTADLLEDRDLDSQLIGGEETSIKHPLNRDDLQRGNGNDARQVRQNGISYRNNGYADLPSGSNYRHDTAEWVIAQQDVLIDSSGAEISHHQIKEQDLAPQIQIQRLTAQLTAAYNRIAALEEQLLAKRWK
ncbi:hypothetical protein [Chamaesiphon sp. VAR_48_metabat_135_sub]|uniref:hypothetical protein n=1 Tax=Chamaesiphon sp. VAR_48_metabat_135_sub TaxID=2964699 RepID=UPI00286CA132|nr:hypothetical protein [Chamaesiphon sp. VAR_48_metabat_135_sub]